MHCFYYSLYKLHFTTETCIQLIRASIIYIFLFLKFTDEMSRDYYRELTDERNLGFQEEDLKLIDILHAEKMAGYNGILDHVLSHKRKCLLC